MSVLEPIDGHSDGVREEPRPAYVPIVGIGASAGGLEAVSRLLGSLPQHPGMALVLVQHLDPTHASRLVDLLSRISAVPVLQAMDGAQVEADHVYVIPPNTVIELAQGTLRLTARAISGQPQHPIDQFFRSLAAENQGPCFGVILSGTGSDGTLGVAAIKTGGGITFAQDTSASYGGMPTSAIAAGCIDFVLSPDGIAEQLLRIVCHSFVTSPGTGPADEASGKDEVSSLAELFRLLLNYRGVQFANYKRATISRRLERRMVVHHKDQLADYVALVKRDPIELEALYRELLIHVTQFFRDPESYDALSRIVLPALLEGRKGDTPLRIWVPGCSTGEEVYSLAICLLESLEERALSIPVKIFGTDVSEPVIATARAGRYTEQAVSSLSPERKSRYLVSAEAGLEVSKAVRDLCIFARQDVTQDPPFSKLDLISCRNTLIYMGPSLQERVFSTFHYALNETGILWLGRSETIGPSTDHFAVVDRHHRIYKPTPGPRHLMHSVAIGEREKRGRVGVSTPMPSALLSEEVQRQADRIVLARYGPPGVVIDDAMEIVQFRGNTGPYLVPAPGAPSLNLFKMARPELHSKLRGAIEEAKQLNIGVTRHGVRVKTDESLIEVELQVIPLRLRSSTRSCFVVTFTTITPLTPALLQTRDDDGAKSWDSGVARDRLEQLEQELSATEAHLQQVVEQHEVANEELQAAHDELLTSNEELQSTNEELMTAQEELQATNEELLTINDELQERSQESCRLSDDLTNLLTSINIPIVMLGKDLRIRRVTPSAGEVLGLLQTDIGRPIQDTGFWHVFPVVRELLQEVIADHVVREREVQDSDERWYSLSIRPFRNGDGEVVGAVLALSDVDTLKLSEQRLEAARAYADSIVQTVQEPLVIIDDKLRVKTGNRSSTRSSRPRGRRRVSGYGSSVRGRSPRFAKCSKGFEIRAFRSRRTKPRSIWRPRDDGPWCSMPERSKRSALLSG